MTTKEKVTAIVLELRQERTRLAERLAVIEKALEGLEPLNLLEGGAPPFTPLTVVGNPTARRIDPAVLARAKRMFEVEGRGPNEIAQACGINKQAVQYHAKRWKKPTATAERLPGRVRCPACEEWTDTDPCERCRRPVRA